MRRKKRFRIAVSITIFIFIMNLCGFGNCFIYEAKAVTFDELNNPELFLKQINGDQQCTLVAATMLIRRAAMISGNAAWSDITVDKVKEKAWIEGTGIRYTFTYAGITINKASFQIDPVKESILLLASHPEGIVIYGQDTSSKKVKRPHAILLTDYTDQLFYGADPTEFEAAGRVVNSSTSLPVEYAKSYWYVSNMPVPSTTSKNLAPPVSDISMHPVVLSETKFIYDGSEKKPLVSISGLTENVDYTIAYANNVNPGTAGVYITGIGIYKGMITVNFSIVDTNDKNIVDQSTDDIDESTKDKNSADESMKDKNSADESTKDKNSADQSAKDMNSTDQSAKDVNLVDKSTIDKNDLNKIIVILSNQKIKKGNTAAIKYALPTSIKAVKKYSGNPLRVDNEVIISYTSSNSKIARVNSNGIITGIMKGKAEITVTAALADGSRAVYVFAVNIYK